MHSLDIDISDTLNLATFRVTDNSSIDCNIPVKDGLLEVFVPGFSEGVIMRVEPKFSIVFNCANLGLAPTGINPLPPLPDGVYRVHYSISPNAYVYVDYMYFRNMKIVTEYNNLKYDLYKQKCDLSSYEFETRRKNLNEIKDMIDAAKYAAEDIHDLRMAGNLYSEAKSLISKC